MKIPVTPPTLAEVRRDLADPAKVQRIAEVLARGIGPSPGGKYQHWDKLRHVTPPEGLEPEEWWAAIKFSRAQNRRTVPLRDRQGRPFRYTTPDPVLEQLHAIDRDAAGSIALPDAITNPHTRNRYIQSSLIEEAITSSQLEGAATTRQEAKAMLRSGRGPTDRSERMILNNYRAMQLISGFKDRELTPALVCEIHATITQGTLPREALPPYLRQPDDGIAVWDDRDNTRLHVPPPADQIASRMEAMCEFANRAETGAFLHPAVKAIALHFWLAYDHPFVDGNGRTARALFYWAMLSQGYWLVEFISISRILRKAHARYNRSFLYVETDENDLTYFIDAQLRVLRRAIAELHTYLTRKIDEVRATEQLIRVSAGLNPRQVALLSHALRNPGMRYTIESHRASHRVSYQTARTDLLTLATKGLLTQSRSGNAFVFGAVADLTERLRKLT